MIRRFCNLEGWHATTINLTRRWLRILATLALALLLIGANPSSLAQAAPASETVQFDLVAVPSADYVCVNESMTFHVYVVRSTASGSSIGKISGVAVDATVVTPNMGTITPDRLITGFDLYGPAEVEFTYTAGKDPGTVIIGFIGRISSYWAGNGDIEQTARPIYVNKPIEVEVRKCGYKVDVLLMETAPGVMEWTGWADEIRLNADSDTHFSGSADFKYAQRMLILMPKCNFTITVTPTKINYQADLREDKLYLTFVIQNTTNYIYNPCVAAASGTGQIPEHIVDVSLPSVGGMITYQEPPITVIKIFLTRVIDEVTANP